MKRHLNTRTLDDFITEYLRPLWRERSYYLVIEDGKPKVEYPMFSPTARRYHVKRSRNPKKYNPKYRLDMIDYSAYLMERRQRKNSMRYFSGRSGLAGLTKRKRKLKQKHR